MPWPLGRSRFSVRPPNSVSRKCAACGASPVYRWALAYLINGAVAVGVVHAFHERPAQWQRWKPERMAGWAGLAGLAYLILSPVAAVSWKPALILPRRSPLWAGLVSPIGVLQIALLMLAFYRARRARLMGTAGASENDVEPSTAHQPTPRRVGRPRAAPETMGSGLSLVGRRGINWARP
jgi:hypothetical protein